MKNLSVAVLIFLAYASVTRASDGMAKDSTKVYNLGSTAENIIWSGLGVGAGLDYGGYGVNYTAYVAKNVGVFAGVGYAVAKVGYNFGIKLRYIPEKAGAKLNPFAMGMYGYNAAFTVTGQADLAEMFKGFSVGIGTDFRAKPESKGYWSVALLVPFWSSSVSSYNDYLANNFNGDYQNWVHSVAFSLGYHWIIGGHR